MFIKSMFAQIKDFLSPTAYALDSQIRITCVTCSSSNFLQEVDLGGAFSIGLDTGDQTVSFTSTGSSVNYLLEDVDAGETQSVSFPYTIPTNSGFYDIVFDASLSGDECPGDNTKSKSFEVPGAFDNTITGTGGQYAKDDGNFTQNFNLTGIDITLIATDYEFYGDGQIHAIQAAIIGENLYDAELQAVIMVANSPDYFYLEPIAYSTTIIPAPDELINTELESSGEIKWMRFAFDPPV